jgi:crotonobetainyl-CoA:carnitine CoA-transferase CaiB-like acyl-CoA transferase
MTLLTDIKVLDLSCVLSGTWATQCLADFGATVWKVEKPRCAESTAGRDIEYDIGANRGKRSVAIDFDTPEGQELVRRLAARADVLVESSTVEMLAQHGLSFEQLQPLNPRLVYCSIPAFEQEACQAANDLMTGMYAVSAIIAALYERKQSGAGQRIGLAPLDPQVNAVRFTRTPVEHTGSAPLLGQHTDEILIGELGLTMRELASLSMRAVIN